MSFIGILNFSEHFFLKEENTKVILKMRMIVKVNQTISKVFGYYVVLCRCSEVLILFLLYPPNHQSLRDLFRQDSTKANNSPSSGMLAHSCLCMLLWGQLQASSRGQDWSESKEHLRMAATYCRGTRDAGAKWDPGRAGGLV